MTVVVTGGCGFIGSHLVDVLLERGERVVIIDNLSRGRYLWWEKSEKPVLVEASILDEAAVRSAFAEHRPRSVYHMAAHHFIPYCESNPYEAFTTNVQGTLNILDAAAASGSVEKAFFASTGDVYAPCSYPHRESDVPAPVFVYGETKLAAEAILRRYKSAGKAPFNIVIGQLFNAAGSRETNPHLLPEIVRQLAAGASVIEVGNTWPVRDFVDVRSMTRRIVELTERVEGLDIFNIGSGKSQSVEQALGAIVEALGRPSTILSVEHRKRPSDRAYLCPCVDKLVTVLGRAADAFGPETAKAIWAEPAATRVLYG